MRRPGYRDGHQRRRDSNRSADRLLRDRVLLFLPLVHFHLAAEPQKSVSGDRKRRIERRRCGTDLADEMDELAVVGREGRVWTCFRDSMQALIESSDCRNCAAFVPIEEHDCRRDQQDADEHPEDAPPEPAAPTCCCRVGECVVGRIVHAASPPVRALQCHPGHLHGAFAPYIRTSVLFRQGCWRMERCMRSVVALCVLGIAIASMSGAEAKPGGCLKYGAAGAVAGHMAGHHAVKGAIVGCAAGMWRRHEYNKEMRAEHAGH
jgi:hypothetical protein